MIHNSIKRLFALILNWDLIQKSQLVLFFAIFLNMSLFFVELYYVDYLFISPSWVNNLWFTPSLIGVSFMLIALGQLLKSKVKFHHIYTYVVLFYAIACVLFLHFMMGLLNIINGVMFIGSLLAVFMLFPLQIAKKTMCIYVLGYVGLMYLMFTGYLDYALSLTSNALAYPKVEEAYVTVSIVYSVFYIILILGICAYLMGEWRERSARLNIDQYNDPLSRLLNETGIRKVANLQLEQAYITQSELSVIVLDVDNLQRLNDDFGRQVGDEILQHIASVLRQSLRSSDMIARINGGTFILVLAFTPATKAEAVAEMCRLTIAQTAYIAKNQQKIYVKASFGLSSSITEDFELIFQVAHHAMRNAKENGKDQVCSLSIS